MSALDYPAAFRALVARLKVLPGIGPRGAERIALWTLGSGREDALGLAEALHSALSKVVSCPVCGFFMSEGECSLCSGSRRNMKTLCVVERATDILPIERSGAYHGRYHALGGRLSPLEHVGPEDLRLAELTARLERGAFTEVILALSTDVEGEATANYLADLLAPRGVRVSRLAQGMPAGGGLEHADELTLARALAGRRRAGDQ
jgi:recombination protein RecR